MRAIVDIASQQQPSRLTARVDRVEERHDRAFVRYVVWMSEHHTSLTDTSLP